MGVAGFETINVCILQSMPIRIYGRTVDARVSCARGREFEYQRPAKSYTAFQTVCHRFCIYAIGCVALAL